MYRVRINNEEEYGLLRRRKFDMNENQNDYFEEYEDCEDCEDYDEKISLVRTIVCPYCSTENKIDLQDECEATSKERQMGPEIMHMFDTKENCCKECGRPFRISGYISEYPKFIDNSLEDSLESKYNQVIFLLLIEKEILEHLQNMVGAFLYENIFLKWLTWTSNFHIAY